MDILEKIQEAARLLKEAARQLEEGKLLELDFEIRIKAQLPTATLNTELGENTPPSK